MTNYTESFPTAKDAFLSSFCGDPEDHRVVRPDITIPILAQQPEGRWSIFDGESDETLDEEAREALSEELVSIDPETEITKWEDDEVGYGGVAISENDRLRVVRIWFGGCSLQSALSCYVFMRK